MIRHAFSQKNISILSLLAGTALTGPALLQADDAAPPADAPAVELTDPQPRVHVAVDAGLSHRAETDVDGGGEFSVTRAFVGGTAIIPLDERLRLDAILLHRYANWDFSDLGRFGGQAPWEDVHAVTVSAQLNYQLNENWSAFGGPILTFAGEEGARVQDTISGGGAMGLSYRPHEGLRLGFGLAATTELEDSAKIVPILIFHWAFAEGWAVRSARLDAGSVGSAGIEVVRDLNDRWSLAAGAGYQYDRFRLDSGGYASRGIGQDSSWPLFFRASYKPNAQWHLTALTGVSIGGKLRIGDNDGNPMLKEDYDPTPFIGFNALMRF